MPFDSHCDCNQCPVINHLPDIVIRYDREGRRLFVNQTYLRVTGVTREQVLGRTTSEFSAPFLVGEPAARITRGVMQVVSEGRQIDWDVTWRDEQGRRVCYEFLAIPERRNDGEIASVLAVARNVSAQRETTRRLTLLDFALDQVHEALYLTNRDGRFIQVNEEACRALGYGREELLGMGVFDIDPDFTREHWLAHWLVLKKQGSFSLESRHRTKDGHLFPVEVLVNHFQHDGEEYNLALVRDISERRQAEALRRRHRQEFRALVENSPDTVVRYDHDCIRIYANPAMVEKTGKAQAQLLGRRPSEDSHSPSLNAYEARMREVINSGKGCDIEVDWPSGEGRSTTHLVRITPETDSQGKVTGVLCVGRDISALKLSQRRLEQAEAQAQIGHWEWDYRTETSFLSAEVCRIFGQPVDWRPHTREVLAYMPAEDRDRIVETVHHAYRQSAAETSYSYRINRLGGGLRHLHSNVRIEYDTATGNPTRLIGTTQDVTEIKTYEYYLHDLIYTDSLTGLPNRTRLTDNARQAVAEAERKGHQVGIMLLDLDRFKEINDTFGHEVGDRILFQVAERLRGVVRGYDTVARLSGDEFAIVLPEIHDATHLERISRKIFDTFAAPFLYQEREIFATTSIGIALFPQDGNEVPTLLQYADAALGHAKERGRACHRFYSTELTARSRERLLIESALRQALPRQELQLHYQPQVDLTSGRIVGAEALLRWRHPELGNIPPDRFIPVAEDTGLIMPIGEWVLVTAFRQAALWNTGQASPLRVAVNLSTRQFQSGKLAEQIFAIAEKTACQPDWIELEITESLLLDDKADIRTALEQLRAAGFTIAIDDFGTGYSALGYLNRFPIQTLKIDRSFVSDILTNRSSAELVKAILSMAHALHLSVVAEGIERPGEQAFLQTHGSQLGQGYLFGKPMPAEEFEHLMANAELAA